jgi:hypothetical protein
MVWLPRGLVAALLIVASVTLPLALEQCAIFCVTEHSTAASSSDCHHESPVIPQIGADPARCGHADSDTFSLVARGSAWVAVGSWDLPVRSATVMFADGHPAEPLEVSSLASAVLTGLSAHLRI